MINNNKMRRNSRIKQHVDINANIKYNPGEEINKLSDGPLNINNLMYNFN